MTLKYESEILYDLMKREGDNTPSDVLPYESELKEKYLNQVVGAYPKLQDYRPEWLNYNLTAHLPSGFPVETLTDVTQATINNVVPYAYGKAILKGQTLVNLVPNKTLTVNGGDSTWRGYGNLSHPLTPASKYFIKANIVENTIDHNNSIHMLLRQLKSGEGTQYVPIMNLINNGYMIVEIDSDKPNIDNITFYANPNATSGIFTIKDLMIIEYQEGMENWDIPYFEGMQSVKMPVLTTSNEDGTKTNILTVNEHIELRGIGGVKDELNLLTGELVKRIGFLQINHNTPCSIQQRLSENIVFKLRFDGLTHNANYTNTLCDKFKVVAQPWNGTEIGCGLLGEYVYINIPQTIANTVDDFKTYLLNLGEINLIYKLQTEVVKTVDLNIKDQDGVSLYRLRPMEGTMTLTTGSDTIQPTFTGEVPVEAITQNLGSFIKEE